MKTWPGHLHKMRVEATTPVIYRLNLQEEIIMNELLGKTIHLAHTGNIFCIQCGRKTNKSFQQGYCFPCLRRLQECNLCMIHPERCKVEEGKCPSDDWAHSQCHQRHVVYLANSSGLKVGITRNVNVPSRWIDQGAKQAIAIFSTENRYQAGIVEVALKKFVADKTDWRAMLKRDVDSINLFSERDKLFLQAKKDIDEALRFFKKECVTLSAKPELYEFEYPVRQYPEKISSLSLDKTPKISGKLMGIKGQYLLLDSGVLNIRKFNGYEVEFSYAA